MCFPLDTIKALLILAVVIFATFAILGLLIPFIVKKLGIELGEGWALLVRCFRILVWAVFTIFIIIVVFMMLACLWSFVGGGLHLGR